MRMLGKMCHYGPGGRDCVCCNEAPGKSRRAFRRMIKRGERQRLKRDFKNMKDE